MTTRAVPAALCAAACLAAVPCAAAGAPEMLIEPTMDLSRTNYAAVVGYPIEMLAGMWYPSARSTSYRWLRCSPAACTPIPGATGPSYTPSAADLDRTLRVATSVETSAGPASALSANTTPVRDVLPPGSTVAPLPPVSGDGSAPVASPTAPAAPAQTARPSPADVAPGAAPPQTTPSPSSAGYAPVWPPVPAALAAAVAAPAPPAARIVARKRHLVAEYRRAVRVVGTVRQGDRGATVLLRDPAGAAVGSGRTRGDGGFAVSAKAHRPGTWIVQAGSAQVPVQVDVTPRIIGLSATRRVMRPGVVALRGRIEPAVRGKIVELQYLDPHRGWRLWRQTRTHHGGVFYVARALPRVRGVAPFTLRVRAAVPRDRGWIFQPAVSRPLSVAVR